MSMVHSSLIGLLSLVLCTSASLPNVLRDPLSAEALSKKWKLEEYSYLFFTEAPETQEMNDYLFLKNDMSFTSISEGLYEEGKWRLDVAKKRIYLSKKGDNEALVFIVDDLNGNELVLIIDDPEDGGIGELKIHFKS